MTSKGPAAKFLDPKVITVSHENQAAAAAYLITGRSAGDAVIDYNGRKATGLATPTAATDAANRQFVLDQVASVTGGLSWKDSVRVASTAQIALIPGSTITTIDGVTMQAGDRVLHKDANSGNEASNGIYYYTSIGTGNDDGTLARVPDMDNWAEVPGAVVQVEEGTQAGTTWRTTAVAGGTIGTTQMFWVSFISTVATATSGSGGGTQGKLSFDSDFGLTITAGVGKVNLETAGSGTGGLHFVSGAIGIDLGTTPGLVLAADGLSAKGGDGVSVDSNGIKIDLASSSGLELTASDGTGQLQIKLDTGSALTLGAGGIKVNKDGDSLTLVTSGGALQVGKVIEKAYVQTLTLDGTDITNGYKLVAAATSGPNVPVTPSATVVDGKTSGGFTIPRQDHATDYVFLTDSGNTYIVWKAGSGFTGTDVTTGMDGDLAPGDKLRITGTYALFTPAA